MPEDMPEDMPDRMPNRMPDRMPDRMPKNMSEYMPEDMPDRMPEDMPDRMPEDLPDRMPEDLPVRKCINVMVGITRSKVISYDVPPTYPNYLLVFFFSRGDRAWNMKVQVSTWKIPRHVSCDSPS